MWRAGVAEIKTTASEIGSDIAGKAHDIAQGVDASIGATVANNPSIVTTYDNNSATKYIVGFFAYLIGRQFGNQLPH